MNIDYPEINLIKWLQRIFSAAENAKLCRYYTLRCII